jgi:hypothetical protein
MLTFLISVACSDDNPLEEPLPLQEHGVPFQVTVVFAPGQLGDKGYADNVMIGVGLLNGFAGSQADSIVAGTDSCNVQFISTFDTDDTRKVLKSWAGKPANPFYEGDYKRRLLVLTEYFMIDWLADISDTLRPDDEVLLLKVNESDVRQAAATYGLEGRLHGLNISAAHLVRKYCRYMEWCIEYLQDEDEEYDLHYNISVIPYYRLYDTDVVIYRDSVYETLAEELGEGSEIQVNSILRKNDTSTYSVLLGSNVMQMAYRFGQLMQQAYKEKGYSFAVTDLGSGNTGWNYYVFGQDDPTMFEMLMLDTQEVVRLNLHYIYRRWDTAIYQWGKEWMSHQTGQMPAMKLYTHGDMCEDNIPIMYDY